MNTQNIALKTKQTLLIDVLSGNYLNGEFDGATGASPDPYLWLKSQDYRNGWLTGVAEYFDKKFTFD
jgi:hypothetical protein